MGDAGPDAPVAPNRWLRTPDVRDHRLVHAVWELTLACNLKCRHCGSRAGAKRPDEMTTQECLDVVRQLHELGTREVTLIGGEAYLRRDWVEIVRAISDAGMQCTLQTGAWHLTDTRIAQAAEAGLVACGVSVDGLAPLHDHLRGRPGSFDAAIDALARLRAQGIRTSANTQITAAVIPQLRDLLGELVAVGVRNWQVQLTVAMGRAADNHQLLMQPYLMNELMPLLAELHTTGLADGLLLQPGNNVGYFGPYEAVLRGSGHAAEHWTGCFAGRNVLGIEADGTIKGCPSLPTTSYAGGNVRDTGIAEIWASAPQLSFARNSRRQEMWGFCASCYYADVCEGGCTWTSHSLLGRPGNNPYCHYRASELKKQGKRERVVRRLPAPGTSFDHGRFDIVVEPDPDAPRADPATEAHRRHPAPPEPPSEREHASPHSPSLDLCRGCNCYVYSGTRLCPHCGADVQERRRAYESALDEARHASARLTSLMRDLTR
ncbi:radical SAM protein [Streptomyces sp. QHH-9511]|uniref:radical SAM/SPASM domain-containing protein n=1 Tax=Streptomyces sp. QHH-9511 TaxID=2684468 RepID=UPI00131857D1|nr:radical SAM protein [Streptomyces sp. QHH-9511]QGZ50290.1 radical SAM protein [Streptomyces sp. QHH-9511]